MSDDSPLTAYERKRLAPYIEDAHRRFGNAGVIGTDWPVSYDSAKYVHAMDVAEAAAAKAFHAMYEEQQAEDRKWWRFWRRANA